MKKIICMLVLIQSGIMMAQTKTVVTPYGEKVTFYPSAPGTADNGLTITSGNIQLGGALTKPSVLTTTAANTLAIPGLQTGAKADNIVTMDANGVLRKITNNSWDINGNAGTTAGTNFIGTTDDIDLIFKRDNMPCGLIGADNIAFGTGSFLRNSTGKGNVAIGDTALGNNTTGDGNTGVGSNTLVNNVTGMSNTAIGQSVLFSLANGYSNTALGSKALQNMVSGNSNVCIGGEAGTVIGPGISTTVLSSIENSILIGYDARPLNNGDENEIIIGFGASGKGSNTAIIGNTDMTSIGGYAPWSNYSDSRLKKNIVSSTYGLDFINKLRPVLYNMKTGTTELQSGFIAQEVEAAANSIGYKFSGVVKPQSDTDFYALSYASFVVPLVKAVQEQQTEIESLQKELNDLKAVVQKLIDKK